MEWLRKHEKHLLVLSLAGKLVFSLHQGETESLAICSMFAALAARSSSPLRQVSGHGFKLVFVMKGDLLLVGKCPESYSSELLKLELDLLYQHILFHVTLPALEHLFAGNASYDLSGLLGGTDGNNRELIAHSETELAVMLQALPVLALKAARQDLIHQLELARQDCAVFAYLISHQDQTPKFVCGLGPKQTKRRYSGVNNVTDFLLLASVAVKSAVMETWMPFCLPGFNNQGHLHCYSSALIEHKLFLVLCTSEPSLERFHLCAQRKVAFCKAMSLVRGEWDKILDNDLDEVGLESSPALHFAIRLGRQYVESKSKGPGKGYLVKRYEALGIVAAVGSREGGEEERRLVWDVQMRDVAAYSEGKEMEVFAIFPPLTTPSAGQRALADIHQHATQNKSRFFSLPEETV
ncbi:hypothetical protein BASA81_006829 [Batrachochytrium salamandrivorans]|nr:hypothetical protein BASA81_006829 [Batrachochytrium salamandrivorans]